MSETAKLLHDLRAPLARARTYAKLLEEEIADGELEYLRSLQIALEDLEARIRNAEEHDSESS